MKWFRSLRGLVAGEIDAAPIPVMDGALTPNSALDAAVTMGPALAGAEDFCIAPDGSAFVSAGHNVMSMRLEGGGEYHKVAELDGTAGPLLISDDGTIFVGVAGQGLFSLSGGRPVPVNRDLTCLTSLAWGSDGRILAANGSRDHRPEDWKHDLMTLGHSGSLWDVDPENGTSEMLLDNLAWPGGVTAESDGSFVFTESWGYKLSKFSTAIETSAPKWANMAGFPTRITQLADGGFAFAMFALRTQLLDFVLRQDDFRDEMVRTIDPRFWIGPDYATDGHYLEPLQGGAIKKLGIQKPWAPPRSYGLVICLDSDFKPTKSYHSRVGGRWHGISSVQEHDGRLYALSKGQGQLLRLTGEAGL